MFCARVGLLVGAELSLDFGTTFGFDGVAGDLFSLKPLLIAGACVGFDSFGFEARFGSARANGWGLPGIC